MLLHQVKQYIPEEINELEMCAMMEVISLTPLHQQSSGYPKEQKPVLFLKLYCCLVICCPLMLPKLHCCQETNTDNIGLEFSLKILIIRCVFGFKYLCHKSRIQVFYGFIYIGQEQL